MIEQVAKRKSADHLVRLSHVHRPWLKQLIGKLPQWHSALEIGCYKGETTLWLHEQGFVFVMAIDTFKGSPELKDTGNIREAFERNTKDYDGIISIVGESAVELARLVAEGDSFDFIYVDGSHDARDVMIDAMLGFRLLKPGGIMVFDDYHWNFNDDPLRTPKPAVDWFLAAHAKQVRVFNYLAQVAVQKLITNNHATEETKLETAQN